MPVRPEETSEPTVRPTSGEQDRPLCGDPPDRPPCGDQSRETKATCTDEEALPDNYLEDKETMDKEKKRRAKLEEEVRRERIRAQVELHRSMNEMAERAKINTKAE